MAENNLQILINNTSENSILKLSSNVVVTSTSVVSKNITIDLNGYTIKNTKDIWNASTKDWSIISVRENGNLTILDSSTYGTGYILAKENDCFAVDVQKGGTLTINSGNYIGNISSVYVHTGTAYINGGYYKVQQGADSGDYYSQTINCYDANYKNGTAKMIISGGTFYNFDPTSATEPADTNQSYLAEDVVMRYDDSTNSYRVVASSSESTKQVLKVIGTISSKIKDIAIKDGQLIFAKDKGKIAFDSNGKRKFYNQITELETEQERLILESPEYGYYFVIEKAVLWFYGDEWVQITKEPEDIVFVGTEFPELGKKKEIYINTSDGNEHVSVWDESKNEYHVVADRVYSLTPEEVVEMFLN